jgi:hypothetical protein
MESVTLTITKKGCQELLAARWPELQVNPQHGVFRDDITYIYVIGGVVILAETYKRYISNDWYA